MSNVTLWMIVRIGAVFGTVSLLVGVIWGASSHGMLALLLMFGGILCILLSWIAADFVPLRVRGLNTYRGRSYPPSSRRP